MRQLNVKSDHANIFRWSRSTVNRWPSSALVLLQSAKSAALGPRRQTEALSEVLAEPMLTRFQAEAAKAEETGWFWKYKCSSVKVHVHYWTCVKVLLRIVHAEEWMQAVTAAN